MLMLSGRQGFDGFLARRVAGRSGLWGEILAVASYVNVLIVPRPISFYVYDQRLGALEAESLSICLAADLPVQMRFR